jgi:head-tail adaptor
MNPGIYKDRITFVDKVENLDGMGGAAISYSHLIRIWAKVTPMTSGQMLDYDQVNTAQGYEIESREITTIQLTTKNGIIYKNKMLSIHSLIVIDHKLKIIAFEHYD